MTSSLSGMRRMCSDRYPERSSLASSLLVRRCALVVRPSALLTAVERDRMMASTIAASTATVRPSCQLARIVTTMPSATAMSSLRRHTGIRASRARCLILVRCPGWTEPESGSGV